MKRHLFFPLFFLLFLTGCLAPGNPVAVPTTGKVTLDRLPVAGVKVSAWPVDALHLEGDAPYQTSASDVDGQFRLDLPAGTYYFFAHGDGLFAYYGRNPVTIPAGGSREMNIGLVRFAPATTPLVSGVSGVVAIDGVPQAGAVIFVYTDLNSQLKGMGYLMSAPTGADGRFYLDLDDGTYYLIARKRQGSRSVGPLKPGDLIGYAPANPLRVRSGSAAFVPIPLLEVPDKISSLQSSLFGATRISGRILDPAGAPVAGVRVLIYDQSQMLDRPLYVSQPTTADGRYVVSLPQGGLYYLAARNTLGGAPAPGDLYGTYNLDPEHKLQVADGAARDGIDMVVEEMW
jgi:hypothetical protein